MAVASILVSEADPDVRQLLVVHIERLGHVAAVLRDDVVVPPRSDLLVVDPATPAGFEHLRLVRAFFPEHPVVCLSALPEDAGLVGRGPTTFLPKPFSLEHLTTVLERAFGRNPIGETDRKNGRCTTASSFSSF
jgi:DNA-binding response OmpR family regulator